MKTVLSAVVLGLLLVASETDAQEAKPRRFGIGVTGGVSTLPSPFVSTCSARDNAVGLNAAASLLLRPVRWTVLQADGGVALPFGVGDCFGVSASEYTDFDRRDMRGQVFLTAARIGLETPEHLPLFRATIGTGRVWGTPYRPLTVWGFAVGGRGKGARFLMEWDQYRTRVNAEHVREVLGGSDSRTPIVTRLQWSALRFGAEFPWR